LEISRSYVETFPIVLRVDGAWDFKLSIKSFETKFHWHKNVFNYLSNDLLQI
jgi:hypothetical protein